MFVTQGVKAVRMDDIAQELSISKRTLYEMFGDKEELLYQSIRLFVTEGQQRRMEQCRLIDNCLETMLLSLRDMILHAPEAARIRRNLKRFYPTVHSRLEEDAMVNSKNDLRRWIIDCINKGYMTTTADSEFVIRVLHDSVQGMMVAEQNDTRDSVEIISLMTYAIVIFIRGLCTANGIEVIDRCFDKYFGNISPREAL